MIKKIAKALYDTAVEMLSTVFDELFVWVLRGAGFVIGAAMVIKLVTGEL